MSGSSTRTCIVRRKYCSRGPASAAMRMVGSERGGRLMRASYRRPSLGPVPAQAEGNSRDNPRSDLEEDAVAVTDTCIITCAVSGAVANKQQCEGIPYTPEEYAKEIRRARDAGATMVHIHAREPDGTPTVLPEHYKAITQAILADSPDIIINYSTGAVGIPMAERVGHIVELKPEIGAPNMGSMNYAKYSPKRKGFVFNFVFENHFDDIIFLLQRMNEAGAKPECECFDVRHVEPG